MSKGAQLLFQCIRTKITYTEIRIAYKKRRSLGKERTPPSLWVEKYKPASMGKIVGQNGAASCAKKLFNWLEAWEKNQGKFINLTRQVYTGN